MKRGNVKAQRRRHRENNKGVARLDGYYLTIDGNPTYQPFAYCKYYQGYLTRNQSILHKCTKRKCRSYETFEQHLKSLEDMRIKNLPDYPLM